MATVKKVMQNGGKASSVKKGKPMGGEIGAFKKLKGADLELEKANYKKFGDGPGSGPSIDKTKKAAPKAKDGKWIQKAVNPAHKGYCTPMTKATCTPKRKALAKTFKAMGKARKAK